MASHVLISSVKDEGPFILEWVAHHRVLGFDAIYVASNDCSDGSDRLLAALDAAGFIGHVPNVLKEDDIPQHEGYVKIRATYPVDGADWLMVLDMDEFLNVHIDGHRVQDLTARAGEADIISICGRAFSDLPQTHWQPGPVTRAFPMALWAKHRANHAIKTLTRNPSRFKGIHNHHMVGYRAGDEPLDVFAAQTDSHYALNPHGRLGPKLRYIEKEEVGHQVAQYNHYAVKTLDSFLLRRARGNGALAINDQKVDRYTFDYFSVRAGKGNPEPSILRYAAETDAMIARMLAVPAVAAAHADCETAYGAAIASLAGALKP